MRLIALLLTGVLTPFAPPLPYGAGHRGVDFSATAGDLVAAALSGRVSYVGRIAGVGTITITAGSKKVTVQPVAPLVAAGQEVRRGEVIARVQIAKYHCSSCLHLGVRINNKYVDPLMFTRGQLLPVGRSSWVDVQ